MTSDSRSSYRTARILFISESSGISHSGCNHAPVIAEERKGEGGMALKLRAHRHDANDLSLGFQ